MSQNDIVGKINKLLNTSKVKVTGNFPIQIDGVDALVISQEWKKAIAFLPSGVALHFQNSDEGWDVSSVEELDEPPHMDLKNGFSASLSESGLLVYIEKEGRVAFRRYRDDMEVEYSHLDTNRSTPTNDTREVVGVFAGRFGEGIVSLYRTGEGKFQFRATVSKAFDRFIEVEDAEDILLPSITYNDYTGAGLTFWSKHDDGVKLSSITQIYAGPPFIRNVPTTVDPSEEIYGKDVWNVAGGHWLLVDREGDRRCTLINTTNEKEADFPDDTPILELFVSGPNLNLTLSDELLEKLQRFADKEGRSLEKVAEDILETYLDVEEGVERINQILGKYPLKSRELLGKILASSR